MHNTIQYKTTHIRQQHNTCSGKKNNKEFQLLFHFQTVLKNYVFLCRKRILFRSSAVVHLLDYAWISIVTLNLENYSSLEWFQLFSCWSVNVYTEKNYINFSICWTSERWIYPTTIHGRFFAVRVLELEVKHKTSN